MGKQWSINGRSMLKLPLKHERDQSPGCKNRVKPQRLVLHPY